LENTSVNFESVLKLSSVRNEVTNRDQNLMDHIETVFSEIRQKVYQRGNKGEMTIKLSLTPDNEDRSQVKVRAEVVSKPPKAKNELNLYASEKGQLFLDDPNQQKLVNVVETRTGNRQKA